MQTSRLVVWLAVVVAALALLAAGAGLLARDGPGSYRFTTLRGESVEVYGRGVYRHDTLFSGSLNRGTDAATLALAVPLLAFAIRAYRRGTVRGALLLLAALAYFLYVYASLALGAAYNSLFAVYVAVLSASLYALARLWTSIDRAALAAQLAPDTPWRAAGVFMLACGVALVAIWFGMGLLPALLGGRPPEGLDSYTTLVTHALDLGVIAPATFIAGRLLLRRSALGYLLAIPLLGILALLGPAFAAQTISQSAAGVAFTPAEIIGPICGFGVLSAGAVWLLATLLRDVADAGASAPATSRRHGRVSAPTG